MKIKAILRSKTSGDLLALISGALLTFAFAPFSIFPLGILAPAILLALWMKTSPKRAAWRGFLFGFGLFGTGVHWVYISMHSFGDLNFLTASALTILFIAILAIFPLLNGYWFNRYYATNTVAVRIFCVFPALWLFLEWVRSWLLNGFPWLILGYSQTNSPLKGYAPILSVFGVTLACLISAGLLYQAYLWYRQKNFRKLYRNLFLFILIWIAGAIFSLIHWTHSAGEPIKVTLVQGNIPQSLKWSAEEVAPTLSRYMQLTNDHWDSQIIIWPESAIPIPLQSAQSFVNDLDTTAKNHHVNIITGIPIEAPDKNGFYNAVIMVGENTGIYGKKRLVPFGEYIPLQKLFGRVFDILQVPMSNFVPAPNIAKPLQIGDIKFATFICYEIGFPQQVIQKDPSINVLLTISNDAWFGESIAQAQHLEMAQMRALELRRPVLFGSNNGLTATIDYMGRIQAIAPPYQPYALTDKIQPRKGKTPWQILNLNPIVLLVAGLLIFALREKQIARKPKETSLSSKKPWFSSRKLKKK